MRLVLALFALAFAVIPAAMSLGQEPVQPALSSNDAILSKLKQLQPNQAVLLGEAQVIDEFSDVAKQFDLHKTGSRGRDFAIKMVWVPQWLPARATERPGRW